MVFKKAYTLYYQTGALFVILIVITGALFYDLYGPPIKLPNFGQKTLSAKPSNIVIGETAESHRNAIIKTQDTGCVADPSIDSEEQNFVNALNQYRTANHLQPVTISTKLSQMAQWTANDMPNGNIIQHLDSNGLHPENRAAGCGVNNWSAEILDGGLTTQTGQGTFNQFKSSAAHNAIMLDSEGPYVQVGVGRFYKPGSTYTWYWAVEFSKTDDGTSGGGGTPSPTSPPNPTNPAGFSAMPVICTNGTWYVHFYWDMTKLGLPAGATPEKLYVDLKTDNSDWGTYSNGPLANNATNLDWGGIAPGENDSWRVNALYQGTWYGYQNVATLKTPACPDGAAGMSVSFISCNADSWKMNFYWPARTGQPQQIYVDLKNDDNTPFWNPDGSSNAVSNGPLPGNATTVVWDGIKGNQAHRWHVNTSYVNNGQTTWDGYQDEATFTTPVCPDSGGIWTGGGVGLTGGGGGITPGVSPPTGSLKITAHLDKASYNQGDSGQFCYSVAPKTPFQAKFYQSNDNTNFQKLQEWDDDGQDYCIPMTISPTAKTGPWQLKLEAYLSNALADSITLSTIINAAGSPTGVPNPSPSVSPSVTPGTSPNPTPTPSPIPTTGGATNTPTPTAGGPTSTPTPTPTAGGPTLTPTPTITGTTGIIDCGTDVVGDSAPATHPGLTCIANAAKTCQPAKINISGTITLFGVSITASTYYEIKGTQSAQNNACQLYLKQGTTTLTFPPGTPQDIIDQATASVRKFDNTDGNCLFGNNNDLSTIFVNWSNGQFSTNDYSTATCTGSYFTALNGGGGTPTPTPSTSQSDLQVAVNLPQIVGQNTGIGENPKPINTAKTGEVKITNLVNNQVIYDQTVPFIFKSNYTFVADVGHLSAGNYNVRARFDNTLWKNVGNVQLFDSGTTFITPVSALRLGDLTGDNVLDLSDYNILLACYGLGNCGRRTQADFNLDGKVDEKDLNIFYTNLSNRIGE